MTTKVTDRLLQASPSRSLSTYWRGLDLSTVAEVVANAAGQEGDLLPAFRYDGSLVRPVVRIEHDALTARRADGRGPVLASRALRDLALDRPASQLPPVITMQAFITVDRLTSARSTLGRLAGWARVVAAIPEWTELSGIAATACDYYGYTAIATDGNVASVLVAGHDGARPGASTERDPWKLRWEEQLFELAIRAGAVRWP